MRFLGLFPHFFLSGTFAWASDYSLKNKPQMDILRLSKAQNFFSFEVIL